MFGWKLPPSTPDPHDTVNLHADEWLAGVVELDTKSLAALEKLFIDLNDKNTHAPMWHAGVRELATLHGGIAMLNDCLHPIRTEVLPAVSRAQLRNPAILAHNIALTHLALLERPRLSHKARYGLLQPLLQH